MVARYRQQDGKRHWGVESRWKRFPSRAKEEMPAKETLDLALDSSADYVPSFLESKSHIIIADQGELVIRNGCKTKHKLPW